MTKNKTNKQLLTVIAIAAKEPAKYAEKSMRVDNLKNKLIGMWLTAPEETDSSELRAEIDAACIAGESAMEELLKDKLLDLLLELDVENQAMPDGAPNMWLDIVDAHQDGLLSDMEELSIEMLEMQQTAGSGEESISDGHGKSVLPTPSPSAKRNR